LTVPRRSCKPAKTRWLPRSPWARRSKRQPQRGCPLANPRLRRRARWAAASTRASDAGGGKPVSLLQSSRESSPSVLTVLVPYVPGNLRLGEP
jgi:hypothetical protein